LRLANPSLERSFLNPDGQFLYFALLLGIKNSPAADHVRSRGVVDVNLNFFGIRASPWPSGRIQQMLKSIALEYNIDSSVHGVRIIDFGHPIH